MKVYLNLGFDCHLINHSIATLYVLEHVLGDGHARFKQLLNIRIFFVQYLE